MHRDEKMTVSQDTFDVTAPKKITVHVCMYNSAQPKLLRYAFLA